MANSTVCFTGHRPKKFAFGYDEDHLDCQRIKELLREAVERSIADGYTHFISGMALGVDTWAAEIVLELRDSGTSITLEAAIPCQNQERFWKEPSQKIYADILSRVDVKTLVSDYPYAPYLMIKRDKYMVDNSARLIAIYDGTAGGTQKTYDYAKKKNLDIVRIDPKHLDDATESTLASGTEGPSLL
jgi:uncharacterized phage-like protein YoqJ